MTNPSPAPALRLGDDWTPAEPGITRKLVALGGRLMAIRVRFGRGAVGAVHAHPHEQLTHVLHGTFRFTVAGEERELRSGDSLCIPGGTPHGALALEAGELLDVFTPLREDLVGPRP